MVLQPLQLLPTLNQVLARMDNAVALAIPDPRPAFQATTVMSIPSGTHSVSQARAQAPLRPHQRKSLTALNPYVQY